VICKFASAPGTLLEFFRNNFDKIIDYLKSKNQKVTIENMREAIWNIGYKKCSTFKPKLEKFFIDFFKARKILDLSSGWGDRLIGAMASDIDCYHGFDPNPCLHPNYKKIIKTLKNYQVNKNAEFKIKKQPFEKAKLKPNFYDLMMTSPPYFTMEIYNSNPVTSKTQSVSSVNSEKEWFDNFLLVWINKIKKALKKDGILALNINQFKNQNYVYWLLNYMYKSRDWNYLGVISHAKIDKNNPQPTFVWKKL
jgi:16S rRNA G966 N2-methylase RsmD